MDKNIAPSTRFAEGLFNGVKFAIVHSLLCAPYLSKERSLELGTSYRIEYLKHCSKALVFYSGILGCTFGMRHLIYQHKDRLLFDLQYNFKFLRGKKTITDIILYFMFSWPMGLALNYLHTGRYLRGAFSYTLLTALFLRMLDQGNDLSGMWVALL